MKKTKLKEKTFTISCDGFMGPHLNILYKGKPLLLIQKIRLTMITDDIIEDKGESFNQFLEDYKITNNEKN